MNVNPNSELPAWIVKVDALNTYLIRDFLGGPKLCRISWAINAHKFMTFLAVLGMMWTFGNFSKTAWIYLALHGSYGFCWLMKHFTFRDPKWEQECTVGGSAVLFLILATYWIAPYLVTANMTEPEPSDGFLSLCIVLFSMGSVIVFASDCQKFFSLKYRQGLITDGFYRYLRHPNYLGEMMIYGSFALLARHWLPWLVLAYWWTALFYVNMRLIEKSLSRYPEWTDYQARTGMLWPRFSAQPKND